MSLLLKLCQTRGSVHTTELSPNVTRDLRVLTRSTIKCEEGNSVPPQVECDTTSRETAGLHDRTRQTTRRATLYATLHLSRRNTHSYSQ